MTDDEPNRLAFISGYYDTTQEMPPAKDLSLGCELVTAEPRVAIDCGCGAGRDTAFLREKGFHVHAFDVEAEAIRRCRERFAEDEGVELRQASFESFDYPRANLVCASASLFFCPPNTFDLAWRRICDALQPSGVFVGNFLGPNDAMDSPENKSKTHWPVLKLYESELRQYLAKFEIVEFREFDGEMPNHEGIERHWHVFSVVAKKIT